MKKSTNYNVTLKQLEWEREYNGATVYDLATTNSHASFYGKAKVYQLKNGKKYLVSYSTVVLEQGKRGKLSACWYGWSATTGRHIKAFAGISKQEYAELLGLKHARDLEKSYDSFDYLRRPACAW